MKWYIYIVLLVLFCIILLWFILHNKNSKSLFVQITQEEYNVILDVKYATEDNFTGKVIYKTPSVFLHKNTASKLKVASEYAEKLGYKIKVFDGFRPLEIQERLFNEIKDERYVSDPKKGVASHSRGVAVDVTLVKKDNLKEVDMGTEFDSFNETAHHKFDAVTPEILQNRIILAGIMSVASFTPLSTEWWHYNLRIYEEYPNYEEYPKLNAEDIGISL